MTLQDLLADPENVKLVTLARAASARAGAAQGACVRDLDGRTYAAAPVRLPSLSLSALQLAVANAVGGGSGGVEAVAVVGQQPDAGDIAAVRDLGGQGVPVALLDLRGQPLALVRT